MRKLLVIPSIDIKDGKIVRVVQGIPELNCSAYGDDPVEMAMIWRAENAKTIHIVDFDSSHFHSHKNYNIIKKICESVVIPIEYGGGITNIDDAKRAFDLGVFRIVVGSLAFENEEEFIKILNEFGMLKVAAAIDVIDTEVVIKGRTKRTGVNPIEYAKHLESLGVCRVIVTDVKTNGMMNGPNIQLSNKIAKATNLKVSLSGGIGGYEDLKKVQDESNERVDSVIIGRALYENKFPCQKIWRVAESGIFN
ncbi:MAG: 1-(5-phosphoribosyl)-5-[(5-phosphoribosylamino)methylideneamino] imidazole-4-carboxamide isomerase [Melioribacteraceae bacterium]|nr:1-(5-phosphoribosyl)-5-[(5-phosphoribosylamino)methylideneamino] imidazole-4-carboxamide isomerase [Melioribacteraceae bacterium]